MRTSTTIEVLMVSLANQILALPKEEQLEEALRVIRELTGDSLSIQAKLQKIYGIARAEAIVLLFLGSNNRSLKTREQVYTALYGYEAEKDGKVIDVYMHKLRKKGIDIETIFGVGYVLLSELPELEQNPWTPKGFVPEEDPKARRNTPWTEEEEDELWRMVENGSDWWAIAEELNRTERGVREKYRKGRTKRRPKPQRPEERPPKVDPLPETLSLRSKGLSIRRIAKIQNVEPSTISRRLRRAQCLSDA